MIIETKHLNTMDMHDLTLLKTEIDKEFDKRIDIKISAKVDRINHILNQLFQAMEDLEDFCKLHHVKVGENNEGVYPTHVEEIGYNPAQVGREVFIYQ